MTAIIKVDTEVLAFADQFIRETEGMDKDDLRLQLAARVKKFSADRMMKELLLKVDDDLPSEEA